MGRARRSKERLERMVSVRLTPAEETAIREEAARRGMSMSNLMRVAALRECRPAAQIATPESVTASAAVHSATVITSQSYSGGASTRSGTFVAR